MPIALATLPVYFIGLQTVADVPENLVGWEIDAGHCVCVKSHPSIQLMVVTVVTDIPSKEMQSNSQTCPVDTEPER
jgi:hypothetical protein